MQLAILVRASREKMDCVECNQFKHSSVERVSSMGVEPKGARRSKKQRTTQLQETQKDLRHMRKVDSIGFDRMG